jgi:hypothetical protein
VLRRTIIDLVLATDMKQHYGIVARFRARFLHASSRSPRSSADKPSPPERGEHGHSAERAALQRSLSSENLMSHDDKILMLQVLSCRLKPNA